MQLPEKYKEDLMEFFSNPKPKRCLRRRLLTLLTNVFVLFSKGGRRKIRKARYELSDKPQDFQVSKYFL
jgi:hypothetical protein